jgi:hypothetical protein
MIERVPASKVHTRMLQRNREASTASAVLYLNLATFARQQLDRAIHHPKWPNAWLSIVMPVAPSPSVVNYTVPQPRHDVNANHTQHATGANAKSPPQC